MKFYSDRVAKNQYFIFYLSQLLLIHIVFNSVFKLYDPSFYQWPLYWIRFFDKDIIQNFLKIFIIFSFVLPIFYRKYVLVRILNMIGHLFLVSLLNVPGHTSNHSTYLYLYISIVYIFFSGKEEGRERRREVSLAAQVLVLSPYFISGFQKIISMGGEVFQKDTFNLIILERLFSSGPSLLIPEYIKIGPWFNYFFGIGVVIECCALFILFFPSHIRKYGFLLIVFHLFNQFTLNIYFTPSIYMVLIFLVFNCFDRKLFNNLERFKPITSRR